MGCFSIKKKERGVHHFCQQHLSKRWLLRAQRAGTANTAARTVTKIYENMKLQNPKHIIHQRHIEEEEMSTGTYLIMF